MLIVDTYLMMVKTEGVDNLHNRLCHPVCFFVDPSIPFDTRSLIAIEDEYRDNAEVEHSTKSSKNLLQFGSEAFLLMILVR